MRGAFNVDELICRTLGRSAVSGLAEGGNAKDDKVL